MDISRETSVIVEALRAIMDPFSSQEQRNIAHQVCQDFENNSPHCVPCGFFLSSKDKDPVVRHFGLHLLEHCIKFRWNAMSAKDKLELKNSVLELFNSGTHHILTEQYHIKDMLSRLAVEIIKREWPQQWPNMMSELNTICLAGETQTELVMLVFLRLAEDVALLPCLPNRRRKDIQQTLNLHLQDLFSFFLKTLSDSFQKYSQLAGSADPAQQKEVLIHSRLSESVLKTLNSFLEWVPWSLITDDKLLLQMLCTLLNHNPFRLLAVDCLLSIVERKGKVEERIPLLILFSEDAMSIIFSAARSAANDDPLGEEHYFFFKRLCQLLVSMGTLLALLWGVSPEVKEPSTFNVYINSILTFSQHPSLLLNDFTLTIWNSFFQHSIISVNQYILSVIPELIQILVQKTYKVGFPSHNDSPSCAFSRLDFDTDDMFQKFFVSFRDHILRALRFATKLRPIECFEWGAKELRKWLSSNEKSVDSSSVFNIDDLSVYIDVVSSQLNTDNKLELCRDGIVLLKSVLEFQTEDFVIMSQLLSCISALIVFLKIDNELLPLILTKLFCSTAFTVHGNRAKGDAELRDFRKHAGACIVRMSIDHSRLLLPAFPQMAMYVKDLVSSSNQLYLLEKSLLLESLVVISNELQDYEKQAAFLKETFEPVLQPWIAIQRKTANLDDFIRYTGLRDLNSSPECIEQATSNRAEIIHLVNVIAGLFRRCKWPKDVKIAEKGGYLVRNGCNTGHCYKHAASQILLPVLEGIFNFIRCVNALYEMPLKSSFHSSLFDIPEGELRLFLELDYPEKCNESILMSLETKLKNFIYFTYETCLQILGMSAQSLQMDFYSADVSFAIKSSVLSPLECLPDYRLKAIFHFFLKVYLNCCPLSHSNMVINVLEHLCPYMLQKLSLRWKKFEEQYGTSVGYEEKMTEMQEIMDDQINRRLTREYFDMLNSFLRCKTSSQEVIIEVVKEDSERKSQPTTQGEKLSELGVLIFKNVGLRSVLVCTCFKALRWLDSPSSNRSNYICSSIFNQLIDEGLITSIEEATFLLESTLSALWLLGEHEGNQSPLITLSLLIYETLRPKFPELQDAIFELTKCKPAELNKFDEMVLSKEPKSAKDKKKRELFKTIVSDIIGKNVGQQFKNDIHIKNLRPLASSKPKTTLHDILNCENAGLCALFSGDTAVS